MFNKVNLLTKTKIHYPTVAPGDIAHCSQSNDNTCGQKKKKAFLYC